MSDFDLDDELLGLAEGTTSSRTKRSSKSKSKSSTKRKRTAVDDSAESDMDMSDASDDEPPARKARRGSDSEGDGDDGQGEDGPDDGRGQRAASDAGDDQRDDADLQDPSKLFPLEGKFRNHDDRDYIMNLPEIEREQILGERAEEVEQLRSRLQLKEMVRKKERREAGAGDSDDDELRGGRSRKTTGTSKTKQDTLKKLRQSRAERGQKKQVAYKNDESDEDDEERSDRRRRASTEEYTDESEDERPKDKDRRRKSKGKPVEAVNPSQLRDMIVTRRKLAEFWRAPWFEEWVTGAWVRFLVGMDERGQKVYRLAEVDSVKDVPERPYQLEGKTTTKQLELRISSDSRLFRMEFVSDSPFSDSEFNRLRAERANANVDLPSVKEAQKIKEQLSKHQEYIMTEADVAAVLAKKGARVNPAAGKAKLLIQRDFAISSGDDQLLAEVNAELAKFDAPPPSPGASDTEQERMRRVNERNRATNREEIKRAEAMAQQERRRQEAALARGDTDVRVDPSARVKTMTRLKYDRDSREPSRPGTPGPGSPTKAAASTSAPSAADVAVANSLKPKGSKFEENVAQKVDVEIDLDF